MTALPMTEADFQTRVIELAKWCKWQVFYLPDSRKSAMVGWPDLTLLRDGRLVMLELKTERGRVRPEQVRVLAALEAVPGVVAAVVRPGDWPWVQAVLR